jgi:hypothetical protein
MRQEKRVRHLNNRACIYCGIEFDPDIPRTVEHVIGRRFVPKGKTEKSWNLIAGACYRCNSEKSDLEGEISAVSLYPWDHHDAIGAGKGRRKARRARSTTTGRTIEESKHHQDVGFTFPSGILLQFGLIAPPQVPTARLERLAHFHLKALFYLITYSEKNRVGRSWPGFFDLAQWGRRTDWGNSRFVAFTNLVRSWELRVCLNGADGYFRALIRKDSSKLLWAWALEWNKSIRCIGFVGEETPMREALRALPELEFHPLPPVNGAVSRMRAEVPLPVEGADDLFSFRPSEESARA